MRPRRITAALAFASAILFGSIGTVATSAASSPSVSNTVTSLQVESDAAPEYRSTIDLKFDRPVDAEVAKTYAKRMINPVERSPKLGPEYISCGGGGKWSDPNGSLTLQYTCSTQDRLAWSFVISPAVKAIIVSKVTEQGLDWWVNGAKKPRNAPHFEVKEYLFHGTMTGAQRGTTVDYQDYMTFRHNLGGGGTGSITWAGRVHPLAD